MTVFVGRSVKDRPAAPCLSKKHKTEHLTMFFALSRQGLTHTHTISLKGRSFFIAIEGIVLVWYIDERLDVSKNKLQYVNMFNLIRVIGMLLKEIAQLQRQWNNVLMMRARRLRNPDIDKFSEQELDGFRICPRSRLLEGYT